MCDFYKKKNKQVDNLCARLDELMDNSKMKKKMKWNFEHMFPF